MNPARKKKLIQFCLYSIGVSLVVFFTLMALKENLNAFYTPDSLLSQEGSIGKTIRLGGMVEKGSVKRSNNDLSVTFRVTDFKKKINVNFKGILPDLFREGQGVVMIGVLNPDKTFKATEVLAKHDEKYMPPELTKSLSQNVS